MASDPKISLWHLRQICLCLFVWSLSAISKRQQQQQRLKTYKHPDRRGVCAGDLGSLSWKRTDREVDILVLSEVVHLKRSIGRHVSDPLSGRAGCWRLAVLEDLQPGTSVARFHPGRSRLTFAPDALSYFQTARSLPAPHTSPLPLPFCHLRSA